MPDPPTNTEAQLRQIIDLLPSVVFAKDRDGRFILLNHAAAALYGKPADELIGCHHADVHDDPKEVAQMLQDDQDVINSGCPKFIPEEDFVDAEGTARVLQVVKIPYVDSSTGAPAILGVATDITARKRAEQALERERHLLHTLMENMPDNIYYKDVEGRFTNVNPALARLFGLADPAAMIGKTDFDFHGTEDAERYRQDELEVMKSGRPMVARLEQCLDRNNTVRWFSTTKAPLRDEQGRIAGIVGISRDVTDSVAAKERLRRGLDELENRVKERTASLEATNRRLAAEVTERKRTEEVLRSREAELRVLVNQVPAVLWTTDRQLRFTSSKGSGLKELGLQPDQVIGASLSEFLAGSDQTELILAAHRRALAGESVPYNSIVENRSFESNLEPLKNEEGAIIGCIGVALDITANKRAEDALRQSEQRFRSVLAAVPDLILILDAHGRYQHIFTADHELLAHPPEQLLGRLVRDVLAEESARSVQAVIDQAIATGKLQRFEYELAVRGEPKWFSARVVRFGSIEDPSVLWVARDITENRRAEQQIQAYQERLRSLAAELSLAEERERRRIAADLHDHIGQALGLTQIKLEALRNANGSDASEHRNMQTLSECIGLIGQTILDTRSLIFDLSPPVLYDLGIEAAIEWLVDQYQGREGLTIVLSNDARPKPLDEGMRVILFRTVRELIINILKHARAKNASVSLWREDDRILVEVKDDGIGFPAANATSQREKVARVRSLQHSRTALPDRRFCEDQVAPRRRQLYHRRGPAERARRSGRDGHVSTRVLLVDDHQMMRDGLRVLLENRAGLEVVGEAENGQQAVKLTGELRPDVVVMDVGLPGLNGVEATRQLLSRFPETKVVALSMHSDKRYVLQMLNAGAAAYLLKNSASEELLRAIDAVRANQSFLSPGVASLVVEHVQKGSQAPDSAEARSLSEREREVLRLLAEGKTSKEIGQLLHLAARTVESHRREIMRKLDLHSVPALTKFAIREGLTSLEP